MKNKYKKRGFTLTEVILVLSVAAIIIILSLSVYNKVRNKTQENLIMTTLNNINSNIESLFGYGYVSSSSSALNQAQQDYIFKSEFPDSNFKINDPNAEFTKGNFEISYQFIGNVNGYRVNQLILGMRLPRSICPEVVSQIVAKGDYLVLMSDSKALVSKSTTMPLTNTGISISFDTSMDAANYVEACNYLSKSSEDSDNSIIQVAKIF